jgi:CxxC motif-containing protein (DUF1111 family)
VASDLATQSLWGHLIMSAQSRFVRASTLGIALCAAASAGLLTRTRSAQAVPTPQPGEPFADLSPELRQLFLDGLDRFQHQFTPTEGLGPVFNESACQVCHGGLGGIPGGPDLTGLGSIRNVKHFGFDNLGYFDPMRDFGGSLLERQSIAQSGVPGCSIQAEVVPAAANILSVRNTPAVWGFGLVDAIPDDEILDHQNLRVDGIRGVANWGVELQAVDTAPNPQTPQLQDFGSPRVGRFGWKAQTATLQQFSSEPLNTELGVSSQFFPQEHTPNGLRFAGALPPACNVSATHPDDPDSSQALAIYHFQALLAPPPRLPLDGDARRGEKLFFRSGCQQCHIPDAQSAPEYFMLLADGSTIRVPQLESKVFHPYSDFLMHDMGSELADNGGTTVGRIQGRARGNQWRTTPLWGIRLKATFLHDGRTTSVDAAIDAHGGEAQIVSDRYRALTADEQHQLVAYLLTL